MMSINYLPEEVLFTILSLLPEKLLLQFIRVCKLWRSIILSNPHFANTYLMNSEKKESHIAILAKEPHNTSIHNSNEEFIKFTLPPQCNGMQTSTYAYSCNGLICLPVSSFAKMYIWNPLTKRLKMIPFTKKRYGWILLNMGFGFDPISYDYKILWMVECSVNRVTEAELYSFNDDCWKKEIRVPDTVVQRSKLLFSRCDCTYSRCLCTQSKCIQLSKTAVLYMDRTCDILSFDLHYEVFGVYPYPLGYKKKSSVLKFEDDYVAMIFESIADGSVSLWTLEDVCDGSNKMSWFERFNLQADWKIDWVYFIFGVGQILAVNSKRGSFLYDYKTKATKELLNNTVLWRWTPAVNYTESLVPPKGFKK